MHAPSYPAAIDEVAVLAEGEAADDDALLGRHDCGR